MMYAPQQQQNMRCLSATPQQGKGDFAVMELVMLFSTASFDHDVYTNQQTAFDLLEQHNVPFETIDASDSSTRVLRNRLLSLVTTEDREYPQFFLRQGRNDLDYFGDIETLQTAAQHWTLLHNLQGGRKGLVKPTERVHKVERASSDYAASNNNNNSRRLHQHVDHATHKREKVSATVPAKLTKSKSARASSVPRTIQASLTKSKSVRSTAPTTALAASIITTKPMEKVIVVPKEHYLQSMKNHHHHHPGTATTTSDYSVVAHLDKARASTARLDALMAKAAKLREQTQLRSSASQAMMNATCTSKDSRAFVYHEDYHVEKKRPENKLPEPSSVTSTSLSTTGHSLQEDCDEAITTNGTIISPDKGNAKETFLLPDAAVVSDESLPECKAAETSKVESFPTFVRDQTVLLEPADAQSDCPNDDEQDKETSSVDEAGSTSCEVETQDDFHQSPWSVGEEVQEETHGVVEETLASSVEDEHTAVVDTLDESQASHCEDIEEESNPVEISTDVEYDSEEYEEIQVSDSEECIASQTEPFVANFATNEESEQFVVSEHTVDEIDEEEEAVEYIEVLDVYEDMDETDHTKSESQEEDSEESTSVEMAPHPLSTQALEKVTEEEMEESSEELEDEFDAQKDLGNLAVGDFNGSYKLLTKDTTESTEMDSFTQFADSMGSLGVDVFPKEGGKKLRLAAVHEADAVESPENPAHTGDASQEDDDECSLPESNILVLIANQTTGREVPYDQKNALCTLEAYGINHFTMDGSDPALKEVRNELFKLSNRGPEYPQFFRVRGDEVKFLGGMDDLDNAIETQCLGEWLTAGVGAEGLECQ